MRPRRSHPALAHACSELAVALALAVSLGASTGADAADVAPDHGSRTPDPRPMAAPYGQPQPSSRLVKMADPASRARRIQLTVAPTYGVLRLPFLGRPSGPVRGAGIAVELDGRIFDFLWLRAQAGTTWHPVREVLDASDPDAPQVTAPAGTIVVTETGGSLVFAMDLGRLIPLLDFGLGALFIRTPTGVQDGQSGGACRSGGGCDVGLSCDSDHVCRSSAVLDAHVGFALDVPVGRFFSFGAHFRYHAPVRTFAIAPLVLTAGARLGIRF